VSALEQDLERGTLSVMFLTQALAQAGSQLPRIWLVTQRAQPVDAGPLSVAQAPAWGLGRVIGHQEFASAWGALIDLDGGSPAELAATLREEILDGQGEDQVGFRDGQRFVPRLVASPRLTHPRPTALRVDGSYLVTGGLGALGLLVARFLADNGARHLILTGRSALPDRASWDDLSPGHPQWGIVRQLTRLEQRGATVQYVAVDVADEQQMTRWLAAHGSERRPPIRGVVHTAGVVADELLLRMSADTFRRVLRPKVVGTWLLHRLLGDQLDFFVLFSSTGSVITSPGQGNYAAGNAFLDALAHYRRRAGLPGLSIGWGPWSDGMVQELALERIYAARGIELITPEAGSQILGRVLGQPPAHLVAITADWAKARETSPAGSLPAMFSGLGQPGEEGADQAADDTAALLAALEQAPPAGRAQLTADYLRSIMSHVLQLDPGEFPDDEPLTNLGMDSMMAIEIKHRVEVVTGQDISVLELLQGMSITGMADRVVGALQFGRAGDGSGEAATAGDDPTQAEMPPGELERLIAETPAELLEQLLAELDPQPDERSQELTK
jgi:NADP-dependent 3-hydroxy acid dehydrogenase YdfG